MRSMQEDPDRQTPPTQGRLRTRKEEAGGEAEGQSESPVWYPVIAAPCMTRATHLEGGFWQSANGSFLASA